MKKAKKIFEELGAWLMAAAFIFLMFKLAAFMVVIVYSGDSTQSTSYSARVNSDTVEMKPVLLK